MNNLSFIASTLCVGGLLACGPSARASVLAYNFSAEEKKTKTATDESGIQSGENTDALNDVADLYTTPSWTNLLVSGDSGQTTGTDTSTDVTVTWHAGGTESGSSSGETSGGDASQQVFYQSLTDQDGGTHAYNNSDNYGATIQLSGLGALMTSTSQTSYSLVIFLASSTASPLMGIPQIKSGNLDPAGTTDIATMTDLGSFSIFTLGDGTEPISTLVSGPNDHKGARGLATITGLTADQVTIAMPATEASSQRTSIAGFAIVTGPAPVPVPEPAAAGLALLGGAALLRRRR